jgi:putative hydrolase of the HAD superfamily
VKETRVTANAATGVIGGVNDCTVLGIDIDGVLIHPVVRGTMWDANIKEDLGIDPADLGHGFFRKYWGEVVVGKRDLFEALSMFLSTQEADVTPGQLVDYWFHHDGVVDHEVVKVVESWRQSGDRRRVVAVSNQEPRRVKYLIRELGLGEILDGALWSFDLGVTKGDPAFFDVANREHLAGARKVIFVDDEQKHVDIAAAAGWKAYLFTDIAVLERALGEDSHSNAGPGTTKGSEPAN